MIPFDFKLTWEIFKLIRASDNVSVRTPFTFLLIRFCLFIFWIIHNIFFLIDAILFPAVKDIPVNRLMFMVGPPRSGTTYLQRILMKNEQCTSMKTWEIVFAPSITQRMLFRVVRVIDQTLGSHVFKRFMALEKKITAPLVKIHKIGMLEFEEDKDLFRATAGYPVMMFHYPFPEIEDFFLLYNEYLKTVSFCFDSEDFNLLFSDRYMVPTNNPAAMPIKNPPTVPTPGTKENPIAPKSPKPRIPAQTGQGEESSS